MFHFVGVRSGRYIFVSCTLFIRGVPHLHTETYLFRPGSCSSSSSSCKPETSDSNSMNSRKIMRQDTRSILLALTINKMNCLKMYNRMGMRGRKRCVSRQSHRWLLNPERRDAHPTTEKASEWQRQRHPESQFTLTQRHSSHHQLQTASIEPLASMRLPSNACASA